MSKREIVITDMTRMNGGRVCLAGYDKEWNCIRPILERGCLPENSLWWDEKPAVYPFAIIEVDLIAPRPEPPHTEDTLYRGVSLRYVREVDLPQQQRILEKTCFDSIEAIFGTPVLESPGFYVMDGEGERSLGTIQPSQVRRVYYTPDSGGKYRIEFEDQSGRHYRLAVTDLAVYAYRDLMLDQGCSQMDIDESIFMALQSENVYLRIGLARGWKDHPGLCFLQLNGVYPFLSYLGEMSYAQLMGWYLSRPERWMG